MNILKNFRNPWEAATEVLKTSVLEGSVLGDLVDKIKPQQKETFSEERIKWDKDSTASIKMRVEIIYSKSQVFKTLYDYFNSNAFNVLVMVVDREGGWLRGNEGRYVRDGLNVILFAPDIATHGIIEEFFHAFQDDFYQKNGEQRTVAQWEAEAKLFVLMVLAELKTERGQNNLLNKLNWEDILNGIFTESTDINMASSICFNLPTNYDASLKIEGTTLEASYYVYLESFSNSHSNNADPYRGEQPQVLPNAYNHIIQLYEKL